MYMTCRYVALISGIAGGAFSLYTGSVAGVVTAVVTLAGYEAVYQYCSRVKEGLIREIESLKFEHSVSSCEIDRLNALIEIQDSTIEDLRKLSVEKEDLPDPLPEEPVVVDTVVSKLRATASLPDRGEGRFPYAFFDPWEK